MPAPSRAQGPRIKDYQIHLPPLGEGSYGVVYRATYRGISDRAVKIFKPQKVDLATVARELEKLSSVAEHNGIVTLHDFDLTADEPYYAMGLHARETAHHTWKGRTLEDLCGRVDPKEAWRILTEISDALAYLHRHQIIHCDIKPSNVLLTNETPPRVKLCDFGQSRSTGVETFEQAGTPFYAPPEQLRDPRDSGEGKAFKWDVYSFGALAYKLITGRLPRLQDLSEHVSDTIDLDATIIDASAEETIVESSSGRLGAKKLADMIELQPQIVWPGRISRSKTVDIELKCVIEKCLSLDPGDRFADMRETASALEAIVRKKTVKRAHRLIGTFAALSILALASTGFAFMQMKAARAASQKENASRRAAEELVRFILVDMGEKLRGIDRMELLEHVAKNAETYFDSLSTDQPTVRNLQALAVILNNRGDVAFAKDNYDDAMEQYGKAYNIAFNLLESDVENAGLLKHQAAESLLHMGDVHRAQGFYDEALVDFEEALELRRGLVDASGDNPGTKRALIECLTKIAEILRLQGETDDALDNYEEALALMREAAPEMRQWQSRFSQGGGSGSAGRNKSGPGKPGPGNANPAKGGSQPAGGLVPPPRVVQILESVGDIHAEKKDFVEAANGYREALAAYESRSFAGRLDDAEERVAAITSKLGKAYLALGNREEAQAQFRDAILRREKLTRKEPDNLERKLDFAESYVDLGAAVDLEQSGATFTAHIYYRKALDLLGNLETDDESLANRLASMNLRVQSSIAEVIGSQLGQP